MSSDSSFESLRTSQNAANSKPGPRIVPSREIPVPTTVSPQLREFIAAPYRTPVWDANPQTPAEWKKLISGRAEEVVQEIQTISKQMGVTIKPDKMEGVPIFRVRPREVSPANRNRLLMNIHGGGYVFNPGEAATLESVLMAGIGKFEVVCVDYRMPPDHPFPAGLDDSFRLWKSLCSCHDPRKLGLFGTSAGGGLAAATVLRAIREKVPVPAVLGLGTPWMDLTETGDTYRTNEWLDNTLVSYRGYLGHAAKLYAGSHDPKDPLLSPIHGDFHGFPPTILTSGTRDLFLSLTVLTHRKLRQAGIRADLQVFEGMSHGQYLLNAECPEAREVFSEIARFFDEHLAS